MIAGIVAGQMGAASDPYWASVTSLLHFDGGDTATTVVDQRGHPWTLVRDAQLDTEYRRFGSASLFLTTAGVNIPGTASTATAPNDAGFLFGAGDFTVELFVRMSSLPTLGRGYMVSVYNTSGNTRSWALTVSSAGAFEALFSAGGVTPTIVTGSAVAVLGTFHHVAMCRSGDVLTLWVDGVLAATSAVTGSLYASTEALAVGGQSSGSYGINGHVDELRITKGVCRYTAPFAPPTAPFPNG